ncbi:hypothetical protein [Lactococcus taiwanensis]|uniref:Uncharacterized protein n=1 Tax=Lactococcus taiwanensis TaxID=1151742 RepID=A0AA45KHE2_9LACT|nr:hypothetical protein [Lactococcus taiwanensis]KZK38175.1 hypothetical protein P7266_0868 [Lactococcus cremoris]QSE77086.1 hypothetical protein JW886_02155 [Lactococcus taiwanensis]
MDQKKYGYLISGSLVALFGMIMIIQDFMRNIYFSSVMGILVIIIGVGIASNSVRDRK